MKNKMQLAIHIMSLDPWEKMKMILKMTSKTSSLLRLDHICKRVKKWIILDLVLQRARQ
jgi:hypothetical protein